MEIVSVDKKNKYIEQDIGLPGMKDDDALWIMEYD